MGQIIIAGLLLVLVTIPFTTLAYYVTFTDDMWKVFRPRVGRREISAGSPDDSQDPKILAVSNHVRAAYLLALSLISVALFFDGDPRISSLLQSEVFRIGSVGPRVVSIIIVSAVLTIVWYIYIGPKRVAKKVAKGVLNFRNHIVPYLSLLPFALAIWAVMVMTAISIIVRGALLDVRSLERSAAEFSAQLGSYVPTPDSPDELQKTANGIFALGGEIAIDSQKYVIVSLLTFSYLMLLQLTNLRSNILEESIDRVKIVAWVVFLVAVGFSLVYAPTRYLGVHTQLRDAWVRLIELPEANQFEISYLLDQIEAHNLSWLMLKIVTGFGNVMALVIVGGALLLRKTVFKKTSVPQILYWLLPRYIFNPLSSTLHLLGLDFQLPNPHPKR